MGKLPTVKEIIAKGACGIGIDDVELGILISAISVKDALINDQATHAAELLTLLSEKDAEIKRLSQLLLDNGVPF